MNIEKGDSFEKFMEMIKDRRGICITKDLNRVKEMENVYGVCLSEEWNPRSIDDVKKEISSLPGNNRVILMTDIDYLLESNSVRKVRNFLKWVYKLSSGEKLFEVGIQTILRQ